MQNISTQKWKENNQKMAEQLAIIGLMAGTSVDGIDAALIWSNGEAITRSNFAETVPYHPQTRSAIFAAMKTPHQIDPKLANWVARDHAHAVERVMVKSGIMPDLIGFHGQTVFHDPDHGISLQIGDAQYMADRIAAPVVHQFRQNDLAAGGQGAPLAPIYHRMMMDELNTNLPAAMVNIGGISNISLWDGKTLTGFDSGPGNALIDDAMMRLMNTPMDENGQLAKTGQVDHGFIDGTLRHGFFHQKGAKSLDRAALYDWIDLAPLQTQEAKDQLASLTALTAASIIQGIKTNCDDIKEIIITGGGCHNPVLMGMITDQAKTHGLQAKVSRLDDLGFDSRFTEAELMAVLAARHYFDLPITFPDTTGVGEPLSGGIIAMPRLK